jgi:hypothetical protein
MRVTDPLSNPASSYRMTGRVLEMLVDKGTYLESDCR